MAVEILASASCCGVRPSLRCGKSVPPRPALIDDTFLVLRSLHAIFATPQVACLRDTVGFSSHHLKDTHTATFQASFILAFSNIRRFFKRGGNQTPPPGHRGSRI